MYKCVAENEAGSASSSFTVFVEGTIEKTQLSCHVIYLKEKKIVEMLCNFINRGKKYICCIIFQQVTNGNITQYLLFLSLFLALCMQYTLDIPPHFFLVLWYCIDGNSLIYMYIYMLYTVCLYLNVTNQYLHTVNVVYILISQHIFFNLIKMLNK